MIRRILLAVLCLLSLEAAEKTVVIAITGMTCPLCTTAIKKSLKKEAGVIKAKVRLNTAKATVIYDDEKVTTTQMLDAIARTGYKGKIVSR